MPGRIDTRGVVVCNYKSIEKLMPRGLQLIYHVVEGCHICTMVAIAICAIHQTRSAQAVCPDNLSAISALPLPILSFTICQSPMNKFFVWGNHGECVFD